MDTTQKQEHTEAIADAIIDVLSGVLFAKDEHTIEVRDRIERIVEAQEEIDRVKDIHARKTYSSGDAYELVQEIISKRRDEMESEASEIASIILSRLGTIEMQRGLLDEAVGDISI